MAGDHFPRRRRCEIDFSPQHPRALGRGGSGEREEAAGRGDHDARLASGHWLMRVRGAGEAGEDPRRCHPLRVGTGEGGRRPEPDRQTCRRSQLSGRLLWRVGGLGTVCLWRSPCPASGAARLPSSYVRVQSSRRRMRSRPGRMSSLRGSSPRCERSWLPSGPFIGDGTYRSETVQKSPKGGVARYVSVIRGPLWDQRNGRWSLRPPLRSPVQADPAWLATTYV